MNQQSPRQCYSNGKLRAPSSRLSLPPNTPGIDPSRDRPAPNPWPVSLLSYLHNTPSLRIAPDPHSQAPGAGYVEEFRSNQERAKHIGAVLTNRMRALSRQRHSSFADVSPGEAEFFDVRVVAPGMVFHPLRKLWEIPNGRPRYQGDLDHALIEELTARIGLRMKERRLCWSIRKELPSRRAHRGLYSTPHPVKNGAVQRNTMKPVDSTEKTVDSTARKPTNTEPFSNHARLTRSGILSDTWEWILIFFGILCILIFHTWGKSPARV